MSLWSGNFKTAVSSLRKSKLRSLFTMLGIIIGVGSVVTIISLGQGLKQQITGQGQIDKNVLSVRPGHLVSHNGDKSNLNLLALLAPSTLSQKDVSSISHLPSSSAVTPINFLTNSASNGNQQIDNAFVAGANPSLQDLLNLKVDFGTFFDPNDLDQDFTVIGPSVATKLYGQANPVGQTITINGQDFIIHGVLADSSTGILSVAEADFNYGVFIPFSTSLYLARGHSNILQILVKTKPRIDLNQEATDINQALAPSHPNQDFSVLTPSDLSNAAGQALNVATGITTAIAAISLLVGGIGIMDIMLVSVSERMREIGLRKAIGATNRQIMSQFLTEGLVMTISGGLIGLGLAYLANILIKVYTTWQPVISWQVAAVVIGFCVLIGIIFSAIPALKAARKDPIQALRGD